LTTRIPTVRRSRLRKKPLIISKPFNINPPAGVPWALAGKTQEVLFMSEQKKRRGRPRLPEDDRLVAYNIRVPLAVKAKLDRIPAVKIRDELTRIARQAFDPTAE